MSAAPVTDLRPGPRRDDTHPESAGANTSATLRQLIDERLALSNEASPHAIAAAIAADLPDNQLRAIAQEGLVCIVAASIRRSRSRPTAAPAGQPQSAKWNNVAEVVAGNPAIFQRRYAVEGAGNWKFLGDFTKADAEWNHGQHVKLAEASSIRARQFRALASRLKGKTTVRNTLEPSVVEELFNA